MKRRLTKACVTLGSALFVTGGLGMGGVWADQGDPGSGFGLLSLSAMGSGMRLVGLDSGGKEGEGQVPYSVASLTLGPYGHALSSVFWPGGTAGSAGSTLGLLGNPACAAASIVHPIPGCPPLPQPIAEKYPLLNDPVVVEAQTNSGDSTNAIDQGDGALTMSATALPSDVTALAGVAGSHVTGVGTFGQSNSYGRTQLTGVAAATSDASSQVRDTNIAGEFKIGSVKSTAHAVTDGKTSSGAASTVVSDFTIAGVPVTVDDKGIHVKTTGQSAKAAVDAVNKAVAAFGFQVYLTSPTHTTKGGATTYDSGNLILAFYQADYQSGANTNGQVVVLGGATVTAAAGPGFVVPSFPPPNVPPPGVVPPPTTTVPGSTSPGTGSLGGFTPGGGVQPPQTADGGIAARLANQPLDYFKGLSPAWSVVVLFGTALMAAGFRRLPDRVLDDVGPGCPLED